jgi:hypothetical protein
MSTKKIILILGILAIVGLAIFIIMSARGSASPDSGDSGFSIRNFFPFGNPNDNENTAPNIDDDTYIPPDQNSGSGESIPRLRKISEEPVAGAVLLSSGTTTIIRYVVKDTGNVYESRSDSLAKRRLTNTTIPKINRVMWLPSGEGFIAQKSDEAGFIETSHIRLKTVAASSTNELALPFEPIVSSLPSGIREVAVSPDGKKIFYYTSLQGMSAYVSNPDGTGSTIVYGSGITEWIPNWYTPNSVFLTTKAGHNSSSYGYSLNIGSKTTTKFFGGIVGGSAIPRADGKFLLVSSGGAAPSIFTLDTANEAINPISIRTIAEKCAWQASNTLVIVCGVPKSIPRVSYPDAWYQGLLTTNDLIEIIDIENGSVLPISDPSHEVNEDIDVQMMLISKNKDYVSFINKTDQSLWLLKVSN